MAWNGNIIGNMSWGASITNEEAKRMIAKQLAALLKDGDTIGFGSGSTSFLAIQEIGKRVQEENIQIQAVPTSHEVELACIKHHVPSVSFLKHKPDWCFDGADEIDPNNNLIKGRGGAMVKEKMIMSAAEKIYILADSSKFVKKLGEKFPVPIEVLPLALNSLELPLTALGAEEMQLRMGGKKDGPVITENGNFILDVTFESIEDGLEKEIKALPGILDSGLFQGFEIEVLSTD